MDEEWEVVSSFLPEGWRELARETGALKGLRKDKSVDALLRTLLLHLACGHSLRETVVRARKANLADLSDVALFEAAEEVGGLASRVVRRAVFANRGWRCRPMAGSRSGPSTRRRWKEPGRTGALWRLHYSVRLPSLACDFFKLTASEGRGTGETFCAVPGRRGRLCARRPGLLDCCGPPPRGVRGGVMSPCAVNTGGAVASNARRRAVRPACTRHDAEAGRQRAILARAGGRGRHRGAGSRRCAIRKTQEAIRLAQRKLRKEAGRKGKQVRPRTLEFARYVIVFTTFHEAAFSAAQVLEWYRTRWQVELVFKRFKSLAQLGHLPKYDNESAKAWLYGKLLVALLVEKLIRHASTVSPWGYSLEALPAAQRLA